MTEFLIYLVLMITPWLTASPLDMIHGEYTLSAYRLGDYCAYVDAQPYPIDLTRRVYWSTAGGNCANGHAELLVNIQDDALMTYCGFTLTAYDWQMRPIKTGQVTITNPYWSGPDKCGGSQ